VVWFYNSRAVNRSTSSYSGFVSVLSSSARLITAVSSVYASARIGMPLCTCTTMWRCGGVVIWGLMEGFCAIFDYFDQGLDVEV